MKINYNKIIENDFERKIYQQKHQELIDYLTTFGETDFWTIIKEVGGSERRMMRLINEMILKNELIYQNNKFNLYNNETKYNKINYDKLYDELKSIWIKKPLPTFLFDQRPVTLNTTIERVKYFLKRNDIYGKKIVFLGDDDLTSIALALTKVKCQIEVLDIDERLINFINQISKEYNLNINARVFNALEDVPKELKHKFDCLITDPTPEVIPFTIFMNDAIDLLKKDNSIIYTSIYSSAMEETIELQNTINKMNLYITEIIPKFTEYQAIYELYKKEDIEFMKKYNILFNEDSICFTESLFRLKVTNKTKKIKINYQGKDVFGKATKRVIKDKSKDIAKDNEYLDKIEKYLKNNRFKKYISK